MVGLCGKTKLSERKEHEMLKTICVSQHYSLLTLTLLWVAHCKTVRQINMRSETASRFCIILDAHIYLPWKSHLLEGQVHLLFSVQHISGLYGTWVMLVCPVGYKKRVTRLPIYLMIPEKSGIFPAQTSMDILNKKKRKWYRFS